MKDHQSYQINNDFGYIVDTNVEVETYDYLERATAERPNTTPVFGHFEHGGKTFLFMERQAQSLKDYIESNLMYQKCHGSKKFTIPLVYQIMK